MRSRTVSQVVVIVCCVVFVATASAAQSQRKDLFLPLGSYPWPEASIAEMLERVGDAAQPASREHDEVRLQLAYLYYQLGRNDEATSMLMPLWAGTSSALEITTTAKVLYPLFWAQVEASKGEFVSSLNQLVLADRALQNITSPKAWAALSRMVKGRRFLKMIELVPMAEEMDGQWDATTGSGSYSRNQVLALLMVLAPESVAVRDGRSSVDQKALASLSPWKEALLRGAEILASELKDMDQIVLESPEAASAVRMNREAAVLSARGKIPEAISLRRSAANKLKTPNLQDARIDCLAGVLRDAMLTRSTVLKLSAIQSGAELMELHEGRMARLGSTGGLYQVLHQQEYRDYQGLLLQLLEDASGLPQEARVDLTQRLVLQTDRLQLRPARRQMAMYRAVAENKELNTKLAVRVAQAKPALGSTEEALTAVQEKGVSEEDLTSSEEKKILEILEKAKTGETIVLEAGKVSAGKKMTVEGGAYVEAKQARRQILGFLDATVAGKVASIGGAVELPADWKGLAAGMTSEDAIVIFMEWGGGQPLKAAVITAGGSVRIIDLPDAVPDRLRPLVAASVDCLATNNLDKAPLAELGRILWRPLGALPKRVTIVPNLMLVGLPFEAMPITNGRVVVDAHIIRYALGLDDGIGRHEEIKIPHSALVLGAQEFQRLQLDGLPEAGLEVKTIRDLLRQAKVRVLPELSLPATGSALLTPSSGVELVHISTHSVRDNDPWFDRLAFPKDDVFAVELALSPLKADLAVFSACDLYSNRGQGGAPVSGITTAALAAVAPQIVTTFWQVQSRGTRFFMTAFHENLLQVTTRLSP